MDKKARDNRANQLNPNNPAYYKSRMGNTKKSSGGGKKVSHSSTTIVHHHHHNNTSSPVNTNIGFRCKLCGKAGRLTAGRSILGRKIMRCGFCKGSF